jgi:tetratricopeptide (TPR) repeat protein
MRIRFPVLSACMLLTAASAAWAAGGGPMSVPQAGSFREQSPEDKAKSLYNDGVREVRKADRFQASAIQLVEETKKARALREAHDLYAASLTKFQSAVQLDPKMHEAWNYVGYTNRKLGNYDVALSAYDRALDLHPGYPEALEYRGEAYLALSRIADAQKAYLDLFATNRGLAEKLLAAMKDWIETERGAAGADATAVSDLEKWVQERAQIASQTTALTRQGAAAAWH